MAIWQYTIRLLPQKEVSMYYGDLPAYLPLDYESKDWWLEKNDILYFEKDISLILNKNKSWSNDIILWGSDDSDNIQISIENNKIYDFKERF